MSTSRTEAFSDGVFAIAITLLVLDLHVPSASGDHLWHALTAQWPFFASYAVSFLIIGIIWINHHAVFQYIARTDRVLLFLNLLLLLVVGFIPFPTALMAAYLLHGGTGAHVAAATYSATMALMGICFGALWIYASRGQRLLRGDLSDRQVAAMTRAFVAGTPAYLVAIAIAFVSAPLCLAFNGALAVFYALARRGGGMSFPAP